MLSEIDSTYGSFESYLEKGLSIPGKRMEALRARLTE